MTQIEKSSENSYLHCLRLDGHGAAVAARREDLLSPPESGFIWLHTDLSDLETRRWLKDNSSLEPSTLDALFESETRPRSYLIDNGLLVVLRGVNTNPGQNPEDMVAIRVWMQKNIVISTRRRKLLAIEDMRSAIAIGEGPSSAGELLYMLVARLADRIGDYVDRIELDVVKVEENMMVLSQTEFRQTISGLRRQIAAVRRFLAPQRDALERLYRNPGQILSDSESHELRDEVDRITRYIEDLELARERTVVIREEFLGQLAQEQNSRMYVLSIVTAVFLPMTFVTGLLGMNVGGLPGLDDPKGFLAAIAVMVTATAIMLTVFRLKKWL
jgi:zinc transporter